MSRSRTFHKMEDLVLLAKGRTKLKCMNCTFNVTITDGNIDIGGLEEKKLNFSRPYLFETGNLSQISKIGGEKISSIKEKIKVSIEKALEQGLRA